METGQITITELLEKIKSIKTVSYRLVMLRDEKGLVLRTMVIEALPKLRSATWSLYNYGDVIFITGKTSGANASNWLRRQKGKVKGVYFQIPPLQLTANFRRSPSYMRYGFSSIAIPYTQYLVNSSQSSPQDPRERFLIADGCPFFPDFQTAAIKLLYGVDRNTGQGLSGEVVTVNLAQDEAWIEHIHLSATSISVLVKGNKVSGTRLEIGGAVDWRFDKDLRRQGRVTCPLPKGLPSKLWIVVSRGSRWLDYRELAQQMPWYVAPESITADPPDLRTRIESSIYRGEGETIEFKSQLNKDIKDKLMKTIAAFANGEGGVVILGIEDDSGKILGLPPGNLNREKDSLTDMIRNRVVPNPPVSIEICVLDKVPVIAIFVDKGKSPPYGINPPKLVYYVRRGATTFPARQEEICDLVLSHRSPDSQRHSSRSLLNR